MAQYAHDGGQHPSPFTYTPDWHAGGAPFNGLVDNSVNPPTILDQHESSVIFDFFRNGPEGAPMPDFSDFMNDPANMKLDGTGLAQLPDFDPNVQHVPGYPLNLGNHHPPHYLIHSSQQQHVPVTPHMGQHNEFTHNEDSVEDVNAMNAAYGLQQMQMVGQQRPSNSHAPAQHMNGLVGATRWSGIEGGHMAGGQGQQGQENLHSPLTSSGRQSANSFHNQQQVVHPNSNPLFFAHEQQFVPGWQNIAHPNMSNAQQQAQQQNAHTYAHFPEVIMRPTQANQPRFFRTAQGQTAVAFGTDQGFRGDHYQAPRGSIPREDEKGANLNNVPFASQLTAHAHSHAHPFTSATASRGPHRHSLPLTPIFPPTTSSNFTGGLPNTSPINTHFHRNLSSSEVPHNTIESPEFSDEGGDLEELQPRKRRKSQRDDEDDEYTPTSHMKSANLKRGAKASKTGDGSDEEYGGAGHTVTSSKSRSSKRRKMSAGGRASPGSQEYATPRDNQSETPEAETKSGSKKKKSSSQNRNNLTEEEKRQNHIKSEKVRRDLIKVQYDHLDDLVPALKSGKSGLSRADVLLEIVNYVENIKNGNVKAEQILANYTPGSAGPSGGYG